jgi:hypothetical protein
MGLIDDVAGFANSLKASTFGFLTYVKLCAQLGYKLSLKPGKTVPPSNDVMEFLGYLCLFKEEMITLSAVRLQHFLTLLQAFELQGWLSKTELESLIGVMVFLTTVFGMRIYYRSFIRLLIAASDTSRRLTITDEIRTDIQKWRQICELMNNRTVMRGVRRSWCNYEAYSDASFSGWGWTWLYFVEDGTFPQAWSHRFGRLSSEAKERLRLGLHLSEISNEHQRIWICFCEALAALFCLRRVLPFVSGKVLIMHQDNQAVAAMLSKLQTSSVECQPVIAEIAWLLAIYNAEIDVHYIKSEDNTVADCGSRITTDAVSNADYKLAIKDHFRRHRIPQSLAAAGAHHSGPVRPELIPAIDRWHPLLDGDIAPWFPLCPV